MYLPDFQMCQSFPPNAIQLIVSNVEHVIPVIEYQGTLIVVVGFMRNNVICVLMVFTCWVVNVLHECLWTSLRMVVGGTVMFVLNVSKVIILTVFCANIVA